MAHLRCFGRSYMSSCTLSWPQQADRSLQMSSSNIYANQQRSMGACMPKCACKWTRELVLAFKRIRTIVTNPCAAAFPFLGVAPALVILTGFFRRRRNHNRALATWSVCGIAGAQVHTHMGAVACTYVCTHAHTCACVHVCVCVCVCARARARQLAAVCDGADNNWNLQSQNLKSFTSFR